MTSSRTAEQTNPTTGDTSSDVKTSETLCQLTPDEPTGGLRGSIVQSGKLPREGLSLDKPTLQPAEPPAKASSLERWLTVLVFLGSGLVFLSLYLQSALVFVIGELVCLLLAPIVLWLDRARIRQWWHDRWRCPACGSDLRGVKGKCPGCGRKRLFE